MNNKCPIGTCINCFYHIKHDIHIIKNNETELMNKVESMIIKNVLRSGVNLNE